MVTFQDVVALLALAAALITVPAAVLAYRAARRDEHVDDFTDALRHLRNQQVALNAEALLESPAGWKQGDLPILGKPDWILDNPIDVRLVDLVMTDSPQPTSKRATPRPIVAKGESRSYSELLLAVGGMTGLFNGRIYRLMSVGRGLGGLEFSMAQYFDFLDTSEVLAFESAERVETGRRGVLQGALRNSLGDPFDLRNRVASLGVNTLTIRLEGTRPTFFMHERDPRRVAVDSALLSVVPAGEFTPSDRTLESVDSDFDLWRNIMREYAEEYLGEEEARGQGGRWIDYEESSPYLELQRGLDEESVRCWVLGIGVDPLNWKPELLTVCVLESGVFDAAFKDMVNENEEGRMLAGPKGKGLPFDRQTVLRYATAEQTAPSSKACLTLAWQHRRHLKIDGAQIK